MTLSGKHVHSCLQSYCKGFLQQRYPLMAKVKPHPAAQPALGWPPKLNKAPKTESGFGAQRKASGSAKLLGWRKPPRYAKPPGGCTSLSCTRTDGSRHLALPQASQPSCTSAGNCSWSLAFAGVISAPFLNGFGLFPFGSKRSSGAVAKAAASAGLRGILASIGSPAQNPTCLRLRTKRLSTVYLQPGLCFPTENIFIEANQYFLAPPEDTPDLCYFFCKN